MAAVRLFLQQNPMVYVSGTGKYWVKTSISGWKPQSASTTYLMDPMFVGDSRTASKYRQALQMVLQDNGLIYRECTYSFRGDLPSDTFYAGFGMQSPFVPALLRDRGFQSQDLGFLFAAAMVVRVVAGPMVARTADLVRRHTLLLFARALLAALATISLLLTHNITGLLGIALVHGQCWGQ
jgi:MFS_1 like family